MKIVYFITGLGLGGAETATINLANRMVQLGHDVSIYYITGKNEHQDNINPTIKVVGINMNKTFFGLIKALSKTTKSIREYRPDVVHGNMIHANIFIRLLRIFVNIPIVVCSEHTNNIRSKYLMYAYRITDFLSDVNTNVSKESTSHFIKEKSFSKEKSTTVYNGIYTKNFKRNNYDGQKIRDKYCIGNGDFLFLHVGRLTEAKDHSNLLEAFSVLDNGYLILLGKGELESDIKNIIENLSISDRVILAGAHSNVNDYYSAADCLVISSAWEGMPMVVIEAMCCELPIITTDVGGAMETIADNRWIVPVKNSMLLSQKMAEIQSIKESERITIGKCNYESSHRFDIDLICGIWSEIYCSKNIKLISKS